MRKKLNLLICFGVLFCSNHVIGQWTACPNMRPTTAACNVGIGFTSAPSAKLHVIGTTILNGVTNNNGSFTVTGGLTNLNNGLTTAGAIDFTGLGLNNTLTRVLVTDAAGFVSYRNASTIGADNLGNHKATQNLNMKCYYIDSVQGINFCNTTKLYEEPGGIMPNLLKATSNFSVGALNSISGVSNENEMVGANNTVNDSKYNEIIGISNTINIGTSGSILAGELNLSTNSSYNLAVGKSNNIFTSTYNSGLIGEGNQSTFSSNNLISGSNNYLDNALNNFTTGIQNSINNDSQNNAVSGDSHTLDYSVSNSVTGSFNVINQASNNATAGNSNGVSSSSNNNVAGEANILDASNNNIAGGNNNTFTSSNDNLANGKQNTIDNSHHNLATGTLNTIRQSDDNLVSGSNNSLDKAINNFTTGIQNSINNDSQNNAVSGDSHTLDYSISNSVTGSFNVINQASNNATAGNSNGVTSSSNNNVSGEANILDASNNNIAGGFNHTLTSSNDNLANGKQNTINGSHYNLATGTLNTLRQSDDNTASGTLNVLDQVKSSVIGGSSNLINGSSSIGVFGGNNHVTNSLESGIMGEDNTMNDCHGCGILGGHHLVEGTNTKYQIAIGRENIVRGYSSIAIGDNTETPAGGQNRISLGHGVSAAQTLLNTCDNSLFVGFNSDLPTLSVTTASGVGTFGTVHINDINTNCITSNFALVTGGDALINGVFLPSDRRYKNSINSIKNALDIVNKLEGKTYEYKTEEFKSKNFDKGRTYGFIAQELMEVVPEAVKIETNGYYGVNYQLIIPILSEAIKAQQVQIDELKASLKNGNSNGSSIRIGDNLNNTDKAELFQNAPNPFNDLTVIKYMIPASVQNAAMYIYDMNGRQIKMIKIESKGAGSVTIEGGDLSEGMYLYSLITDGKEVSTKRMILTKN
jgi:Chaperone of endosialidase